MTLLRSRPQLLAAFRRGDRDALEEVYWHYVDWVERLIRHGFYVTHKGVHVDGARGAEIADLLQEVFARAFAERARLAYDGLRDYAPYLGTIARNLLVDWSRRRGRELSLEDLPEHLQDGRESLEVPEPPEADFADAKTMQLVEQYLSALPEELRAVHEERYVQGRSQQAAAAALGISRQQVRTREARLRKGLRRLLRARQDSSTRSGRSP